MELSREKYLTFEELKTFFKWLKTSYPYDVNYKEYNLRNYLLFRLAYLHGMRISEVLALKWEDIDFKSGLIMVRRLKDSISATQIMESEETRDLKRLKNYGLSSRIVIAKKDGTPLSRFNANAIANKASLELDIKITPHSMKHSCGVHLAIKGENIKVIQHHLGHKDVQNTFIYLNYSPQGDANKLV